MYVSLIDSDFIFFQKKKTCQIDSVLKFNNGLNETKHCPQIDHVLNPPTKDKYRIMYFK